jgi:hypothetical protein
VQAGAAGLAVAAFGAAVIPQIANLKRASKAQTKYSDAVASTGRTRSRRHRRSSRGADVRRGCRGDAARGGRVLQPAGHVQELLGLDGEVHDGPGRAQLRGPGADHSEADADGQGTATQLDRLVKTWPAAGQHVGFDTLSKKVGDFANQALKGATDKAIHFARALSEGNAHGPIASFMEYAKGAGPRGEGADLQPAEAVANLLEGASQAGPGMLTLVNAMAKLVAAVPPELIGNLMQMYAAFKLIKLAGAGVARSRAASPHSARRSPRCGRRRSLRAAASPA